MTREARHIKFDDFAADLEHILETLGSEDEALLFEKNGKTYRVELETGLAADPFWYGYDVEEARRALRESAGALKGVDIEKLKADIYAARGQDSHGRPA